MDQHAEPFFRLSLDLQMVADFDGKVIFVNRRWETLGWTQEDLLGKSFMDFVHPDDQMKTIAETKGLAEGRQTLIFENRYLRKDGNICFLGWTATPSAEKQVIYAIARDMTYQKQRELVLQHTLNDRDLINVQLIQASKLAALGTLGAGVAHELNNPLVAVRGYAQMIELSADLPPKFGDYAKEIIKASKRMQKIIDHLRTFGRQSRPEDKAALKISAIVSNCLVLLEKQLLYSGIKVELSSAGVEPLIWGDPTQLESVFQNLLINSRDAFEQISDSREKFVKVQIEQAADGMVAVTFSDNAGGIPTSVIDKIFDPFFTTKDVGKGTGLGLSITHGILKEHGGSIKVTSQPSEGTEFSILFPVYCESNPEKSVDALVLESAPPAPASAKKTSNPKILVVEDDLQVAELLTQFLSGDFEVDLVVNPAIGLQRLREVKYEVVITDLNMPGISGLEILVLAKQTQLGIPVLIMSGRALEDDDVQAAIGYGADGFIKKPFESVEDLRSVVRNAASRKQADQQWQSEKRSGNIR